MKKRALALLSLASLSYLSANDLPSTNQGKEAMGFVNPSARFEVDNGWNMFLVTEFLWWVPRTDGLFYAQSGYTGDLTLVPDGTINFKGHMERVKPAWAPGFRIGFGGNMGYDEWDILLNWTWYKSHAKDSSHGDLLVLWGHPDVDFPGQSATGATYAKGIFNFQLNIIDLEMGRYFWVGKHMAIRPFICARGAWIDQTFKIRYDYKTSPESNGHLKAESDFEGGGIRGGMDMRFALLGGWSLYGTASASMMYGYYNCDFREKWEHTQIAKSRDGFHNAATSGQLVLGVRWDTYVHHDRYHFGFYAGWEQNTWFGLNKMNHFFNDLHDGNLEQMSTDLNLAGGTFGIRFDF
ncbi:MAG: hypothetical protein HYX67_06475 [Candidatus Melainabacteria bacterium]|nr:hypothetical protein [Candidatus Melainabacteria bacterium]